MNMTEAAYIAGFIDGEGCISVKTGKRDARDYVLRLRIVQTQYDVLFWIKTICGVGTIYKRPIDHRHLKPVWELSFNGRDALFVLQQTYPFLKVKRLQAEAAFKFKQTMVGRGFQLSADQIKERQNLRIEINSRSKCGWNKK